MVICSKHFFISFNLPGKLDDDLGGMFKTKCGDNDNKEHKRRRKRFARLGSVVWPKDIMPISISVNNAPRGYSIADIEDIAIHCAKVS